MSTRVECFDNPNSRKHISHTFAYTCIFQTTVNPLHVWMAPVLIWGPPIDVTATQDMAVQTVKLTSVSTPLCIIHK